MGYSNDMGFGVTSFLTLHVQKNYDNTPSLNLTFGEKFLAHVIFL